MVPAARGYPVPEYMFSDGLSAACSAKCAANSQAKGHQVAPATHTPVPSRVLTQKGPVPACLTQKAIRNQTKRPHWGH